MTRTKELRKNDLQTKTNVTPLEMSGRGVIAYVCFYVSFCSVVNCGLIPFYYFFIWR